MFRAVCSCRRPLCRGDPTWHWCQVKVFSPTLRLRVPSPLAGEGQGEGVYGSAAAAHYPPSWPSPTRGEGTRERSSGDETSLSCDQCPPVVPLLSPRPTSSNLLLTVPDRLNWGAKRLRHGSFALALAE